MGRRLESAWPGLWVEYRTMATEGDRVLDRPLPEIGGKGLFTAALEAALLRGEIDGAVHSLKDLPTEESPGLALGAVPERADPRDVLVSSGGGGLEELRPGAAVGTSSLRRRALLLRARSDCRVVPIRGNVETRVGKMTAGEVDALVLAAAGLHRLGLADGRAHPQDPARWLPAPGQGALAVQVREDDGRAREILARVDDPDVRSAVRAERALLAALEGGCRVPIGALAEVVDRRVRLGAIVLSPDGTEAREEWAEGPAEEAERLGRELAAELRARGAERILAAARG